MGVQKISLLRVLHLESEQYPEEAIASLRKYAIVTERVCQTQEELYLELERNKYDAIFTRIGLKIDAKCMKLQSSLRYIVTATTGLNHIDIDYAESVGVNIISLKGEAEFLSSIKSTAEHAWALLLALVRNLKPSMNDVISGNWNRLAFQCDELDGKTLGIIGYGRLGKLVAGYARAFGMKVIVHDLNTAAFLLDRTICVVSIEELLSQADHVMLMISYSRENIHYMDRSKFSQMKRGAYFINVSRGELVDEESLLMSLENNALKGAALDVLSNDSVWDGKVQGAYKLLEYARNHSNLIITPHVGGMGKESTIRTRAFVTQRLISAIT